MISFDKRHSLAGSSTSTQVERQVSLVSRTVECIESKQNSLNYLAISLFASLNSILINHSAPLCRAPGSFSLKKTPSFALCWLIRVPVPVLVLFGQVCSALGERPEQTLFSWSGASGASCAKLVSKFASYQAIDI